MSKRNRDRTDQDMFSSLQQGQSLSEIDDAIFGKTLAGKYLKAAPVDIFKIYPDTSQPRRAIPVAVRGAWQINPNEMVEFLNHWAGYTGVNIPLYLSNDPDFDRPEYTDPVTLALVDLIDLAISIKVDGLSNPITVIRNEDTYRIETGERRWMAYHLLNQYDVNGDWNTIPARDIGEFNVWRQASENGARANLNAISKARQLALLLMDLHGSHNFRPIQTFQHEKDFYAQAANKRTPRGKREMLVTVMGLKHGKQVQYHLKLLTLPKPVWEAADDLNWPEGRLRSLTPLPEDEAIAQACVWARKDGYKGTIVTLCADLGSKTRNREGRFERFTNRTIPQISQTIQKLRGEERRRAIEELEQLVDELRRQHD
jgi:hypothetical protein